MAHGRMVAPLASAKSSAPLERFAFIDGLRGCAALGVVLFHVGVVGIFRPRLELFVPDWLLRFWSLGGLGVRVFFVLSGFVMAYSHRGVCITARYLGRFALRRSLRLDPPYWATIGLILVITAFHNSIFRQHPIPFPHRTVLIANVFYLQDLLRLQDVNIVFWTLCFEVQFYLVLTLLTGVAQRSALYGREFMGVQHGSVLLLFAPVAILSFLTAFGLLKTVPGLFINLWFSFFLGVLVWAVLEHSVAAKWLWIYMATVVALGWTNCWRQRAGNGTGEAVDLLTAIAIYAAGLLGFMDRWLSQYWIQFLGRISYSLYLVHVPVGATINDIESHLCSNSKFMALPCILLSVCASIGVAFVMYRLIELPAARWSRRLK